MKVNVYIRFGEDENYRNVNTLTGSGQNCFSTEDDVKKICNIIIEKTGCNMPVGEPESSGLPTP